MCRLASSLTYGVRVNYFPSLSTNKKQGAVSQVWRGTSCLTAQTLVVFLHQHQHFFSETCSTSIGDSLAGLWVQERASGHQEQGRDRGASAVLRSSLSDPLYFSRSSMADPEYSPSVGRPRGMVTPQVNVAEGACCSMPSFAAEYPVAVHLLCMLHQRPTYRCYIQGSSASACTMRQAVLCIHAGATHVSTADFPMPMRHSMMEPAIFDEVQPEFNRKLN